MLRNKTAILAASGSLLLLIVWGKVAGDLYGLPGPDSAVLLLQFMLVIFIMEASITTLTLDSAIKPLEGKNDDLSESARMRAMRWERVQLLSVEFWCWRRLSRFSSFSRINGSLKNRGDPWNSFCPLIVLKARTSAAKLRCLIMRSGVGWSIGSGICSEGMATLSSVRLSRNQ